MKILYVASARIPTEKAHGLQIMKMCEAFAALGHEVTLVVPTRRNSITEDSFAYYGVRRTFAIHMLPALDTVALGPAGFWLHRLTFACAATGFALSARPDLIYSRDELALWCLSFSSEPFVFEEHEGRWNFLVRRVMAKASAVTVITDGLRKAFRARGVPEEKLIVAPDGVDLVAFDAPESKQASRVRLGLPQDARIALYAGRLDGWKGTTTLFQAAVLLPEDVQIVVIGGEPDELDALRARHPRVRFLGPRPYRELPDNQAAADVLVLPNTARDRTSAQYTSPLKLFTYMASGRPIVASDLPSLREVLDERCAYFVAPDDAANLAAGIREALDDAGAGERAACARERVNAYTWDYRAMHIVAALPDPVARPNYLQFARYLLSGSFAALVDISANYVLHFFLWYLYASIIAFILTFFVSFLLQKYWTFRENSAHRIPVQSGISLGIALLNLALNTSLMYTAVSLLGVHYLIARIIVLGLISIESYILYKYVIFRRFRA